MAKESSRASWNLTYERGLVDTLLDLNVPKYRGQNGWVAEGWRSIADKFNQKFPLARFTKQQIQEKEKELKGNYKTIRDARKQSGTGWDDALGMIIAEPQIWDKLVKDYPKVRKFRSKPFPLFNTLAALYEGSVATGDLNFVSIPQVEQTNDQVSPSENETIDGGLNPFSSTNLDGGLNPFSSTNPHGQGASSVGIRDEVEPTSSACSGQKGEEPVKKRKQSHVAMVLEDYLDFRKKQSKKFEEEMKEAPKQDDKFSIANCVATLEAMEELTDLEKAKALPLFKCQLNRELFINTKTSSVRLYWLKEEIEANARK